MFNDNPFADEWAANAETPHGAAALAFARALADGDYAGAHAMLSRELKVTRPPKKLKRHFESMIAYGDGPVTDLFVTHIMPDWPEKQPKDVAWVYVSISGETFSEAVSVVVAEERGALVIRGLTWGRP